MLTAENGKKLAIVVIGGLIAMVIHQKFVAPLLVKKPNAAAK